MTKQEFQIENERRLEKVRGAGIEAYTFDGWKLQGRFVKRGEKAKAFKVQIGQRRAYMDPITGEDVWEPRHALAYGFTEDQTR